MVTPAAVNPISVKPSASTGDSKSTSPAVSTKPGANTEATTPATKTDESTSSQFFLEVCTKDMINGLEEGLSDGENQSTHDQALKESDTKQEIINLATEICKCAAPKFNQVVLQSLDKPDNAETKHFFEQKAYELILDCAAKSNSPLLKN